MTGGLILPSSGRSVSRETELALEDFEALVAKWTRSINLVSQTSLISLRDRHTFDSAQLFDAAPQQAESWVDLGAGGGFPGLVIAILARELSPNLSLTLIESDLRKATFLRAAIRQLGLKVAVLHDRIEALPPFQADVVSARALAPLPQLLTYAERHLKADGLAIFPKGARFQDEIATARESWNFIVDIRRSLTDSKSAVLMIRNIQRADQR